MSGPPPTNSISPASATDDEKHVTAAMESRLKAYSSAKDESRAIAKGFDGALRLEFESVAELP